MKSVYNEVGCINANAKSFQKIHDNSGDDHDEAHDKDHDNVDNMISNIMISVPMVTGTEMTLSTLLHHNYTSHHPPLHTTQEMLQCRIFFNPLFPIVWLFGKNKYIIFKLGNSF